MRPPAARWSAAVAVAVALSSVVAVLTPVAAAQSRFLSFLGGRTSTQPPAAPKAQRQWLFGPQPTTPAPARPTTFPAHYASTATTPRPARPTTLPAHYASTATTPRPPGPTTFPAQYASTATTPTRPTTYRIPEVTTRKLETTTSERHIISAPLKPCPDGQRMSPDRKCVENYTDPEDSR